jgi:hypothetical protein
VRFVQPTISAESAFGDDAPVIGSHPLLDGANIPLFGATTVWDFNGVVRRPANLAPSDWRLTFSAELSAPYWNLLARELAMIALNPRHPAVIAAGLSRKPKPAAPTTLVRSLTHLRRLARWAGEHAMPPLAAWREDDLRRFIDSMDGKVVRSTIRFYIDLFRDLHELQQVLACGGVRVDPWRGKTARQAAGVVRAEGLSTPVIPPGQWFSLIRAAWTYVHVFAPDILPQGRSSARTRRRRSRPPQSQPDDNPGSTVTALSDDTNRPERAEDRVSSRAAIALREAMERLLAGRPHRTDGRLIKDNLWKEAQVSRAAMNRAHQILAEWDARVTECGGLTKGEARKHDEITELRTKLAERTRECTDLQRQLDAAATAIAALHHDNTLLRQELDATGILVTLDSHRP